MRMIDNDKYVDESGHEIIENINNSQFKLQTYIDKGDLNGIRQILEKESILLQQLLPHLKSEEVRSVFSGIIDNKESLIQKMVVSNNVTLFEVVEYLTHAAILLAEVVLSTLL